MSASDALAGWLAEIERNGWRRARPAAAARAAGLDPRQLLLQIADRQAALVALLAEVASASCAGAMDGETVRERLFDGLMQGFDVLQEHRPAVLVIHRARDPAVLRLVAGHLDPHLRQLAAVSGFAVSGWRGRLRRLVLAALLWRVFACWCRDDSPDMAATMAELDRLLAKAEQAATQGLSPDIFGLPGLSVFCRRFGDVDLDTDSD